MTISWTRHDLAARIGRRGFLRAVAMGAACLPLSRPLRAAQAAASADKPARRPNIIVFFTDDQGYNDVGCFGSPKIRTPRLDRMAAEGMRFTSFYAQPVCGPSRAALMTGCYPIRVAEPGNRKNQHNVLHPKEITVAEVLKDAVGVMLDWIEAQVKASPNVYDDLLLPVIASLREALDLPGE